MSEILPIELSPGANLAVPKGSGFLPVYEKPLPTNVQPGEEWSFTRIAAKFRAVLIETSHEKSENLGVNFSEFETDEEVGKWAFGERLVKGEEIIPAGINNPQEAKTTQITRHPQARVGEERIKTTLERSIFPINVNALVELVNSDIEVCSMTMDGTFRWFSEEGGFFSGQCQFSGYLDLTNPLVIALEKIMLRISIAVPLSVPSEVALLSATAGASPGAINLLYDKEVK